MNIDETLVYFGGDVKALGSGKVGGYLVRFGTPDSADIQGDYFDASTYFGRAAKAGLDVVYHHGIGRVDAVANRLGNTVIGDGAIEMKADGLWIESLVNEPEVYAKAERGELGWSSGSVDRLVKRQAMKAGVTRITQWPLIEASLSPKPVDPRNRAIAIKALVDESPGESPDPIVPASPASGTLAEQAEACASQAAALAGQFRTVAETHPLRAAKRDAIKGLIESLEDLYSATAPRPDPAQQTKDEALSRLRRKLRLA